MENMMTEICEYLNNYFWDKKISGTFTIKNGRLTVAGLKNGQYFRIIGSTFNDGVHVYPTLEDSTDETFRGQIWAMTIPRTVIALASEIEAWQEKYGGIDSEAMSPYNSESFAGYSYSKSGTGSASGGGSNVSWQDVFGGRLNKYRRLRGAS